MELNADFGQRVVIRSEQLEWQASPMAGVDRRMLDRLGGEVARATTIVRYAPGSAFSAHTHTGGEEFIVLDGVFQDEHGDYPAGTYVRNPPTSSHTPGSELGCTIFVKLWQFDLQDRTQLRSMMSDQLVPQPSGVATALLFQDNRETVRFSELEGGATFDLAEGGGTEVLVLDGSVRESGDELESGAWVRLPDGQGLSLTAGPHGAKVWVKTGHLVHAAPPAI